MTKPPREIAVSTDEGWDILITEELLPTVTDEELAKLRLTREQLHRLFAQGLKLMEGKTVSDRVRPVASETLDGKWFVYLVRYSPLTDPLMQGRRPKGVQSRN